MNLKSRNKNRMRRASINTNIQTDHEIEGRLQDIAVVDKDNKTALLIDVI